MQTEQEIIIKVQGEICESIDPRPSNKLGSIDIVENVSFLDKKNLLDRTSSNQREDIKNPVKSLTDKA